MEKFNLKGVDKCEERYSDMYHFGDLSNISITCLRYTSQFFKKKLKLRKIFSKFKRLFVLLNKGLKRIIGIII